MNAIESLTIGDINLTRRNARDLWTAGNDAGNGYAAENDDVNDAGVGTLVLRANTNTEVAVYIADDGAAVLVGDCNGAWCVRLGA